MSKLPVRRRVHVSLGHNCGPDGEWCRHAPRGDHGKGTAHVFFSTLLFPPGQDAALAVVAGVWGLVYPTTQDPKGHQEATGLSPLVDAAIHVGSDQEGDTGRTQKECHLLGAPCWTVELGVGEREELSTAFQAGGAEAMTEALLACRVETVRAQAFSRFPGLWEILVRYAQDAPEWAWKRLAEDVVEAETAARVAAVFLHETKAATARRLAALVARLT